MDIIKSKLFSLGDTEYKAFSSKLMPTVDSDTVIGVQVPKIRKLAKEIKAEPFCDAFLNALPHKYYEENNLHAFLICEIKDFDDCINQLNNFLPFVDNWATCDSMRPKIFKKNKDKLIFEIDKWLNSSHTYTVRFGIETLMAYYLDDGFSVEFAEKVAKIDSDEYYINMMIAWYFATALAKQWDAVFPYISQRRLSPWVHRKTIQKAVESYQITEEKKEILRALR